MNPCVRNEDPARGRQGWRRPRSARVRLALVIAVAAALGGALPPAAGANVAGTEDVQAFRQALKEIERDLLLHVARQEREERAELLRHWRSSIRHKGVRLEPAPPGEVARRANVSLGVAAQAIPALSPNKRANDRLTDRQFSSAQSEVSIAASGERLVAAWNDGETISAPTGPIGFATSTDGGATWRDGGSLPITDTVAVWQSDPTVTVNERTGEFYLTALAITTQPLANALAVIPGSFSDSGFLWGRPAVVRASRDTLPDKSWIAADSLTGNLYASYTTFFGRGRSASDQIEFQRSTDGGSTWSPPLKVSPPEDDDLVQGSRPAVGPTGEVYVVWATVRMSVGTGGLDQIQIRTSRDRGASFEPTVSLAEVVTNFSSGAPGFNRGYGLNFPSIAVDRSAGPFRGRIHVCWTEALDYYSSVPPVGAGVSVDSVMSAGPTPFAVGDLLRGEAGTASAGEAFSFSGEAGQTVEFYMDSVATTLNVALVVQCAESGARLAYNLPPGPGRPRFLIVSLPNPGDYQLQVLPVSSLPGGYRIRTAFVEPNGTHGRDERDVFTAHSDDGWAWSQPVRVSDGPARYDDWLPEVAVAANGRVFASWYDWRNSPAASCEVASRVSLARSDDGGASWGTLGALTDHTSDWSTANSNLIPNQGDYMALFADSISVRAAWADARSGDPDVYYASYDLSRDPALPKGRPAEPLAVADVHPNPSPGVAMVECRLTPGLPARLEVFDLLGRRVDAQDIQPSRDARTSVRLAVGARLAPGVYTLRLVQGTHAVGARLAIVR